MHRRLPRLPEAAAALALLAACAFPCPVAASRAGRGATGAGHARAQAAAALLQGVNIGGVSASSRGALADREIAQAKAARAKVVRVDVPWSALEPLAAGSVDANALAFTDRLVDDAAAAGIRVLMTVDSTPCWASTAPAAKLARCNPNAPGPANAWPPRHPADYAAFVAFLAARYGPNLAAIEVWNEPDQSNEYYLAGPNKAANDAALLRAAYPAIKAADPSVPVLGGSLVGSNGAFLKLMYAAGIQGYYDGLSVHFYTLTLASLRAIHEVQLANGDHTPLWLAEFGWSSCWPWHRVQQEQGCVNARTQALNLTNTLRVLARTPYVASAVVYKLQDSRLERFGLLSVKGARKRSFRAFARAIAAPFGRISRVTLRLRRRHGRVIASGSAPVGDFMHLEAFVGHTLRYQAVFTLNRFNRYRIAIPAVLGTRGLRVRVYEYWSGRARAAHKTI